MDGVGQVQRARAARTRRAPLLARHRKSSGSLAKAAFLSSRDDALANVAIVAAGLVTAFLWRSAWPDLAVGLGIATLNTELPGRECFRGAVVALKPIRGRMSRNLKVA